MTHVSAGLTVAITGAGGFIGSHLTELALRQGLRVRALVHYNALGSIGHLAEVTGAGGPSGESGSAEARLTIVAGDVLDGRCLRELIEGCDQVFHLAALIGVPYSYRAPSSYVQVNAVGTLNLLEAAREAKPERVIVTSTSEVYGSARRTPMDEEHPLAAQSPYAASKIAADHLAQAYHLSFGVPVVTLRPFNAFGPRQSTRAVIPTILGQALSPECDAIRLGSVEPVRDWTYVEDVARGYLALARAPLERVAGRVYNLATGRGRSVEEIARLALEIAGATKPILPCDERRRPPASEVERLIGDASQLSEATGWRPAARLEEGLRRTVDWLAPRLAQIHPDEYRL